MDKKTKNQLIGGGTLIILAVLAFTVIPFVFRVTTKIISFSISALVIGALVYGAYFYLTRSSKRG